MGGSECAGFEDCAPDSAAFDHPGVVLAAAAGDEGYLGWLEGGGLGYAGYPASSPHVVAVGGTRLGELGVHGEWTGESVWNDGGETDGQLEGHGATGGGCSVQFEAPPWQQAVSDWADVGCEERRAVSDVSADADPYSGLAVYDSGVGSESECEDAPHWCTIGGTSLATPLISATFALAGGAGGVEYPAKTVYENVAASPTLLHDASEGSNGECLEPFDEELPGTSGCTTAEEATSCDSHAICLARTGYDGPTGLGTPDGIGAFTASPQKPGARTGGTSGLGSETATLVGSAEPDGKAIKTCLFEYGTTVAYGSSVPCSSMPADTRGAPPVEAHLSDLLPNSTYYYRLVVTTEKGEGKGERESFQTFAQAAPGEENGSSETGHSEETGTVVAGAKTPAAVGKSPPVPDARLASASLTVSRTGTVIVRVSCPAAAVRCSGTVSLRTLEEIALGAHSAARTTNKPDAAAILTLASATFKIAGGASASVKLHLSNVARALLAHAREHTLRVRALVVARDPAGATHTTQTTVTIRASASSPR